MENSFISGESAYLWPFFFVIDVVRISLMIFGLECSCTVYIRGGLMYYCTVAQIDLVTFSELNGYPC